MSLPRVGEAIDNQSPTPDDERLWSVTTIISVLDKPALVPWAAKETATAAVDNEAVWRRMLDSDGRDEAIRYLTGARFRRPKGARSAKDLGTAVHKACESYALSGTRPHVDREVAPFLEQFDRFLNEFQPAYTATEVTVYSPTYGYAGTCDGFFTIDGMRLIFDYKSSAATFDGQGRVKTPYPEVALQLAAYRHAELAAVWRARRFESFKRRYYLLSGAEQAQAVPVPEVDGGVAIIVTPDHYGVHPVRCDASVFDAFLYCQEAARWSFETSRDVIEPAMIPPHPLPVADSDPFAGLPA